MSLLKAEMKALLSELETFSPEAFVKVMDKGKGKGKGPVRVMMAMLKDTIRKAKWEPEPRRLSGGAIYPHWSTVPTPLPFALGEGGREGPCSS